MTYKGKILVKILFLLFVFTLWFRLLYSYHNCSSDIMCDAVSNDFAYDLMSSIVIQNYGSQNVDNLIIVLSVYLTSIFFLSLVLMGFRRGTGLCWQCSVRI